MLPKAKPKILVVNDDNASLLALTGLLEVGVSADHYTLHSARSGDEALRMVMQHDFAVILLELNMPGMDGFETADAIHRYRPAAELPIIVVTAFVPGEIERLNAYQNGAMDILFTPIIAQVLHAKVGVFVALARKNTQLQQQARKLGQRTALLIAANKRLTREIEERQLAERNNHAKDAFLAMLGHELRNPLSAISSAAALIVLSKDDNPALARAAAIIERQTLHLSRIVDDLLDLGRAMSGKLLLSKQPLDLAALVTNCLDTFRATGRSTPFALHLQLAQGWIMGDPTRIAQLVNNLLDNAFKYTPPGGKILVTIERAGDGVELTVRDSGMGMSADLLPHVFDVFVQGNSTLVRAQGGLGIGLALVRRLAELHDGNVSARSDGPGQGSTFCVRLPCHAATGADNTAPARQCNGSGKAVLLIEDNDDGRDMMVTMLAACGHPVQQAADGVLGVQMARTHRPEVALIDLGLPGIDGYEVARQLRADAATRHIRLVALTGYGLADDQRRVLDAGFDMHLLKPVDIDRLLAAIGDNGHLAATGAAPRQAVV